MIQPISYLFSRWFHDVSSSLKSTEIIKSNGSISSERAKVPSIAREKVLFKKKKSSVLIDNHFGKPKVICLIIPIICKTQLRKNVF